MFTACLHAAFSTRSFTDPVAAVIKLKAKDIFYTATILLEPIQIFTLTKVE
jgi:hypothetical protein